VTTADSDRAVRRWLGWSIAAVLLAVAIGGITRLTESGLSITEWQPVTGILPPLGADDWERAYQSYLLIPEARGVHLGITLPEFRVLFWWEWIHRVLARLVGLVLAVPYLVLLARGAIRRPLRWRLAALPILAGAQGALGWYMVRSGLEVGPSVSAYRLTAHLAMALLIFGVCAWTLLDLQPTEGSAPASPPIRYGIAAALGLAAVTLLSGGFVAGLDAGHIYNTFPLMGGRVVPLAYRIPELGWRNPFENPVAAQFNHRVLAITTAAMLGALWTVTRRQRVHAAHQALSAALVLVVVQVALGIATLLLRVPVTIAVLHQVNGVLLLGGLITALHRVGHHPDASVNRHNETLGTRASPRVEEAT